MPVLVSVVVRTDVTRPPNEVITSVDRQSLPTTQFELVILDCGMDEELRRSIDRLTAFRPNVRVLPGDAEWLEQVDGTFVLPISHDHRLYPESLERLVDYAEKRGLDAVAGRAVQLSRPLPAVFLRDSTELAGSARELAVAAPIRLLRRQQLHREGDEDRVGPAAKVGVFADYPAGFVRDAEPMGSPIALHVGRPSLSWLGSQVRVDVSGTAKGASSEQVEPTLLLRHLESHLTYVLPSTGSMSDASEAGLERQWQVSSTWSPLTAAAGLPLPLGQYQIDVVLSGDAQGSAPVCLPGASLAPGFLDDLIVVTAAPNDTLHIDIGGTRQALITSVSASSAEVAESAAGSLLTLPLPSAHVQTSRSIPGRIALDRFTLPATIETSSGQAVLTAFLSGLSGSYALSAQFGKAPLRATGLRVEVSGVGTMRVTETPPPAQPGPQSKPAATPPSPARIPTRNKKRKKRRRGRPVAKGPVARLRRAVPTSWEPSIRWLRKQPIVRALYRKATGLPQPRTTRARGR